MKSLAALWVVLLGLGYFRWRIQNAKQLEAYLRTTVDRRTAELHQEISERKLAESKALDLAQNLEERVQERTVELEFAKMAVHKSEERFALAVQGAEDGIWDWDLSQHTLYLPALEGDLGLQRPRIPFHHRRLAGRCAPRGFRPAAGHTHLRRHPPQHPPGIPHAAQGWAGDLGALPRRGDSRRHLRPTLRAAGSQTDITQRKHTEDALRESLTRDPVTELPNRALFLDRLDQALLKRRHHESQVTVVLLDIDGFKALNEKYGHAAGDDILREVARRILGSCGKPTPLRAWGMMNLPYYCWKSKRSIKRNLPWSELKPPLRPHRYRPAQH